MAIEAGQQLLHYRLIEKIGEGGMGSVWKAVDTTLDREVAIKVLSEGLASDSERLARFEREAKLLASLSHPNIAGIYGLHAAQTEGGRFIAMEFVDGEDLAARIARGPLPVDEALEIARQIAEALAAAHDIGVVHRDLKPANVRLASDGTVKVLDFGLAKSLEQEPVSGDPSLSPTLTLTGTAAGMILGTATYMSPEQARGRAVDRRADMWALGCVIYEMLTGRPAFPGETIPDILSAVIGREPDWELLPPGTPVATRRLLRRCLEKKAAQRVRDAADARLELAEIDESSREPSGQAVTPAGRGMRGVLGAAGLVVVTAIVTAAVLRALAPASGDLPAPRLANERQVTFSGDVWPEIDLATDGRTAVYMTRDRDNVVLLDLDGGGSKTIYTAHDGSTLDDVQWSSDSGRLYLMKWPYANRVSSIPRFGGEPRQELDLRHLVGLGAIEVQRLADGNWLVSGTRNTLYVGNDPAGLQARDAQMVGDGVSSIPGLSVLGRVVPSRDGRWLAFAGLDEGKRTTAGVIAARSGEGPGTIDAWAGLAPVGWSTDGRRLYLWRAGAGIDTRDLLRVAMDPATGTPIAEPLLVAPRLPARGLRVSGDGSRLALVSGTRIRNLMEISLDDTPDSADNPRRMRTIGTGRWRVRDFFPDGDLLAVLAVDNGVELFAIEADGTRRSLQRLKGLPTALAVSPDGRTIAIAPDASASSLTLLDVESGRIRTFDVPETLASLAWSPDGNHLAAMTLRSADRLVTFDVTSSTARTVQLGCGSRCEFAYENIAIGPQWPWAAVTSEVETWVVNVESGALRHLASETWGVDRWMGDWIYFSRGGGQTDWPGIVAYRIPAEGGVEQRLLDLPTGCDGFDLAPDGGSIVCDFDESLLDVRVIEGFDPGV